MKKYIVAASVAILALAMSAFAAQLNVNAGTLQAGEDTDLRCDADGGVDVEFTGYENEQGGFPQVEAYNISENCVGDTDIFIEVFDNEDDRIWHNWGDDAPVVTGARMVFEVNDGVLENDYSEKNNAGDDILLAEDIGSVRVKIQSTSS